MATRQDPNTKELVQAFSEQTATLIRKELALAQVELKEKGKHAGLGGGMFGGAGLLALYGLGVLFAGIVMLLGTAMAPWLGALIVAAGLFAVAGVLALTGKQEFERASPPKPEQAVQSTGEDVRHVRDHAKGGGRG